MEQLARMGDQLKSVAERQNKVVAETDAYEKLRLRQQRQAHHRAAAGVRGLGQVQSGLKEETGGVIEQLEGAPVFSLTLRRAAENMETAADRLQGLKTDQETQAAARAAAHRFQQLIDSLKADDAKNGGAGRAAEEVAAAAGVEAATESPRPPSSRCSRPSSRRSTSEPSRSTSCAAATQKLTPEQDEGNRAAGERPGGPGRPRSRPDPTETGRWGGMTMTVSRDSLVLDLPWSRPRLVCCRIRRRSRERRSDDALDSLLEKLAGPEKEVPATGAKDAAKELESDAKSEGCEETVPQAEVRHRPRPKSGRETGGKARQTSKPGSGDVSSKDKELDELLEKLGETKDEPAAPNVPSGRRPPGEIAEPPKPSAGRAADEVRRPAQGRRTRGQGQGARRAARGVRGQEAEEKSGTSKSRGDGPLGQIIKEMRDVEERLGKPDTSEDTQGKQKQIVKQIETLIEQMRQSGSRREWPCGSAAGRAEAGRPAARPDARERMPGALPIQARAKPSNRHSLAGGKDIWGHLPAELRQEMENVFKEDALADQAGPDPPLLPVGRETQSSSGRNDVMEREFFGWSGAASPGILVAVLAIPAARWRVAAVRRRTRTNRNPSAAFGEGRRGDVPEGTLEMMTPETDQAIQNGLAWLARSQNADGSFGSGTYRGNIAVTSLAGLAFMSAGSSPGRGPYGGQIEKALAYVMENTSPSGFIAVAVLVDSRADVFARLRHPLPGRSLRDDSSARDPRETPEGRPADHRHPEQRGRMAISTAPPRRRSFGDDLPDQRPPGGQERRICTFPRKPSRPASDYVKHSQNPDGGFRYMLQGGASAFPRSAAGVVALQSAGEYDNKEVRDGVAYLKQYMREIKLGSRYSHYYLRPLLRGPGDVDSGRGRLDEWYPAIRSELVKRQSAAGYWTDSICKEYGTAMALIILQIPNNYLPIFQR